MNKKIAIGVLALALVSGLCLTMFAVGQQVLRQSAYDPQIQIAEDAAAALGRGDAPASVVPRGVPVNPLNSLATFIAVYDAKGTVLESSGVVAGKPATPPRGVLDWVAAHGEDRFTWEAADGSRIATVVVPVEGARSAKAVLVGRSMHEVEGRIIRIGSMVLLTWLAAMALTVALIALF